MTRSARLGLLFLPFLLSGCFHRRSAPPLPPQAQAPAPPSQPPQTTTAPTPQPQTIQPPITTTTVEEPPEPPKPAPKPRHTTVRKPKPPATKSPTDSTQAPATANTTTPPATKPPAVQQAAAVEGTPTGSPIGQLTSGDSGNSAQRHKDAQQIIDTTNQGLTNLKRSLSDQEQETATQIRSFLKQAKEALNAEDVDGAINLANKAKVLLAELTK